MYSSIKIGVADSHLAYCETLSAFLAENSFTVLFYSDKPASVPGLLDPAQLPDLVIISCSAMYPASIMTIRELKNRFSSVKVLASVVFAHNLPKKALAEAGADGWIIKTVAEPGALVQLILQLCSAETSEPGHSSLQRGIGLLL